MSTSSPFSAPAEVWFIIAEGWKIATSPSRPRLSRFLPRRIGFSLKGPQFLRAQLISIIGSASSGGFSEIPNVESLKQQIPATWKYMVRFWWTSQLRDLSWWLRYTKTRSKWPCNAMYSLFLIKCRKFKSSHHSAQPEHAVQSASNTAYAHALFQGPIGILPGSPTATNDCPGLDPT